MRVIILESINVSIIIIFSTKIMVSHLTDMKILAESRPVTKQSVRLDPIAAPSPSKPVRPKGSANDRFVRLVEQFETSAVNDRWNYCEKIAKCFDKLDGEITADQRERLLAGCAEILDRENVPSSQVRSRPRRFSLVFSQVIASIFK